LKWSILSHAPISGNQPPDADIAIVDTSGMPIWLFDAVCPNLPAHLDLPPNTVFHLDPNGAKSWLEQAIEDKFNKKFAPHIANHLPAKAAVIVTLIKADIVTGHLSPLLLAMSPLGNIPVKLDNSLKTRCPGLG
jgi:hypothetical protein